ncbi:hypothetical protein KUL42_29500 [Alteromonas sp. KUL42]|uniref:hypothetical protein n=1 Tax=Alteromonas sp. KUL42 TaxID=2480797 RepID=UPI0010359BD8|nr:hypothetical protein [Alteromonas sp. KUL42]TAP33689.1 hypothetical protein EYR97_13825 [Alteromonas sp. KUL42]GEA08189.1 hypothetical protein KUL42_29500 [Alteromonas sp. KUL42]
MLKNEILFWREKYYRGFLIIQNHDIHAGFGALLLYALNGIRKAINDDLIPVIDFNIDNCPHFYDASKGSAVWDYYFESLHHIDSVSIKLWIKAGLLKKSHVAYLSSQETMYLHHHDPLRLATFWAWDEPDDKKRWMDEKRKLGRLFVGEYVKPRFHIQKLVSDFKEAHFLEPYTIGIHIRGTDFAYASPTHIDEYVARINQLILNEKLEKYRIFVATDQHQYIKHFISLFGNKVIYLNAIRSSNHIAPFRNALDNNYKKGEDVLIDMLLLSECNHIIKSAAATGELALWFSKASTNTVTDFALQSEFYKKEYRHIQSTYFTLNIDSMNGLLLFAFKLKERVVRGFVSSFVGYWLYKKLRIVRTILKH